MSTRKSQWKFYLNFCQIYDLVPLPATMDTILLYLAYMADRLKYVSIINYLSAVWVLHRINGVLHVDPSSFEIHMTLKGIRRTIGDVRSQARPITIPELESIFNILDLSDSQDLAFWCALIICFRGLLRKSNVVEEGLAILVQDVTSHSWGTLIKVRRTKTISFRQRFLEIPFSPVRYSPFCVDYFIKVLIRMVGHTHRAQLISYKVNGKLVRGTYTWLCRKIKDACTRLRLNKFTSHSLRRGGASAMSDAKFTLLEIKDLGDWQSLSVLNYIAKTPDSRLDLDRRIVRQLFSR